MGLMPAQYWDLTGVTSLRALNAPFLITSHALLAEIIRSGRERHAVRARARRRRWPRACPMAWSTRSVSTRRCSVPRTTRGRCPARGQRHHGRGRGARRRVVPGRDADRRLHVGRVDTYRPFPEGPVTGNVSLYARANAIVVNARAFEQLDKGQRALLAQAADETRASTIASTPDDAALARSYCESAPGSGRVVVLTATPIAPRWWRDGPRLRRTRARRADQTRDRADPRAQAQWDGRHHRRGLRRVRRDPGEREGDLGAQRQVSLRSHRRGTARRGRDRRGRHQQPRCVDLDAVRRRVLLGAAGSDQRREQPRRGPAGVRQLWSRRRSPRPPDHRGPGRRGRWRRTGGGDLLFTVETAGAIGNEVARALVSDPWKRIGDR